MTEQEYFTIKQLENDMYNINFIISEVFNSDGNTTLSQELHDKMEEKLEYISSSILPTIKSPDTIILIEQIQMSLIEMLAHIESNE
jgi:hypothetical protein